MSVTFLTNEDKTVLEQSIDQLSEEIADNYIKSNQGSANVGKILVVGADGNLTLTEMPESMNGDVVGMIDENNNIVITGDLADGTYTFKYANIDGTYANIGSLTVGSGGTEITYTNLADTSAEAGWLNDKRLSTSSNDGIIKDSSSRGVITNYIQVYINQTLRAKGINFVDTVGDVTPCLGVYLPKDTFVTLTYANANVGGSFDASSSVSTWNIGNRITDGAYIRISGALVDGYTADDVIITLDEPITDDDAGTPEPAFTNQIPISTDANGAIFDEDGIKADTRLNSSGAETALAGTAVTGFIPVKFGDVVGFKDIAYKPGVNSTGDYIALYEPDFTTGILSARSDNMTSNLDYIFRDRVLDDAGNLIQFRIADGSNNYGYMRVSAAGLNADSVITINEPIE